jgi:thiamine pyrophosphokinase
MKDYILFLPGRYVSEHFDFYRELAQGKYTIAVDAGYRFFQRAEESPDLLLGDFDSLKKIPKDLPQKTKVKTFSQSKDKTDTELALEFCIRSGATKIDIVQPTVGEPDHFAANLLLLTLAAPSGRGSFRAEVRIVHPSYEVQYIQNGKTEFIDAMGDTVSVIPLTNQIILSCQGTKFDVKHCQVKRGQTMATRNVILEPASTFIISGQALVFRTYSK